MIGRKRVDKRSYKCRGTEERGVGEEIWMELGECEVVW